MMTKAQIDELLEARLRYDQLKLLMEHYIYGTVSTMCHVNGLPYPTRLEWDLDPRRRAITAEMIVDRMGAVSSGDISFPVEFLYDRDVFEQWVAAELEKGKK